MSMQASKRQLKRILGQDSINAASAPVLNNNDLSQSPDRSYADPVEPKQSDSPTKKSQDGRKKPMEIHISKSYNTYNKKTELVTETTPIISRTKSCQRLLSGSPQSGEHSLVNTQNHGDH